MPKAKKVPKHIAQQRLAEAATQFEAVKDALAFEQIRLTTHDSGRLWSMKFQNRTIFRYWPMAASCIGLDGNSATCSSSRAAQRRAIHAKKQLLLAMRKALQPK